MKVAIVGSRTWPDAERIRRYVWSLPMDTIVVTGGAKGVDSIAEATATERGLGVTVHRPDYSKGGRAAPLARNSLIVADADRVVAFWDGQSRGTADTIGKAEKAGVELEVYRLRQEPDPGTCKSCGAAILWVPTQTGRPMPLDAAGQRRIVLGQHTGIAHVLMSYTSHFATCPQAGQHRRKPATLDGKSQHDRRRRPPAEHREQRFEAGRIVDGEGEA